MKKSALVTALTTALILATSPIVFAGSDHGYLVCSNGKPVKNSWGECVKSITRQSSFPECGDGPAPVAKKMPAPAPAPKTMHHSMTLSAEALFDFDQTTIKSAGKQTLADMASKLKGMVLNWMKLTGHTDSMGPETYNQELSEKRASAVKSYLAGQGVDSGKMSASGLGESAPVASNDTAAGRAMNRRVEVEIEATMR